MKLKPLSYLELPGLPASTYLRNTVKQSVNTTDAWVMNVAILNNSLSKNLIHRIVDSFLNEEKYQSLVTEFKEQLIPYL